MVDAGGELTSAITVETSRRVSACRLPRLCKPFATTIKRWRAAMFASPCGAALDSEAQADADRTLRSMRCRSAPASPAPWAVSSSMSTHRRSSPTIAFFPACTQLERRSRASKAARAPVTWAASPSHLSSDFWRASTSPSRPWPRSSQCGSLDARILFAPAVLLSVVVARGGAVAQNYPAHPIKMIVPFAAGGPTDVTGRIWRTCCRAARAAVVVENFGGAGGNVGAERAAQCSAGWLHVLFTNISMAISPALYPESRLRSAASDFVSLGIAVFSPTMLVARPSFTNLPFKDFIGYLKNNGQRSMPPTPDRAGRLFSASRC